MEHEIVAPGSLLDARGNLREPGFARSLLLAYDRSAVKAPAWRVKEWDYYCVLCGDYALACTIADNGYMGFVSASVLDFAAGTNATDEIMTAFPMGRTGLPSSSASGVTAFQANGASLRFESSGGTRKLAISWPSFCAEKPPRPAGPPSRPGASPSPAPVGLEAELVLTEQPGGQSMVIATPFAKARHFYYNQKINCQGAEGSFRFGGREYPVKRGSAFGCLDWGRGVWTWSNTWYWGSASGLAGGKSFGFNIGHGFGDTRAASENMVFYEGKAHKVGRLGVELDHSDFFKPWRAVSEDGRFDMVLAPDFDRASATDLGLIASIQHQVFGLWSGRAVLEDGREIRVEGLRGWCEKVVNRW
ncbi:MAG TPA: DUF2804 domain-containing protein [Spirochaetales bacterium]|nr:DUF2804 domain-containing protein [Spirochaetales bacterium]HRY55981.1 DUF2804 domain-containing protein [Spirochaetia bacterium]